MGATGVGVLKGFR